MSVDFTGNNLINILLSTTDGELTITWRGEGSDTTFSTSGASLDATEWHFIEFAFNDSANTMQVWVDNVSVGTSTAAMASWADVAGTIIFGDAFGVAVDYHLDLIIISSSDTVSLYPLRDNTATP